MTITKYIGMDVHKESISIAVMSGALAALMQVSAFHTRQPN